jgi:hypothetical protein
MSRTTIDSSGVRGNTSGTGKLRAVGFDRQGEAKRKWIPQRLGHESDRWDESNRCAKAELFHSIVPTDRSVFFRFDPFNPYSSLLKARSSGSSRRSAQAHHSGINQLMIRIERSERTKRMSSKHAGEALNPLS